VADNGTGIQLVGTDAKIVQSAIVRNGTGLSLRGFTGEVSENVIIDNEQNIFSDFPLKLDPNYIGQFRERDMPSLSAARRDHGGTRHHADWAQVGNLTKP
jgi:hypothetical protein